MSEVISEIVEADTTNDFISFEIKGVSPISVNKQYSGIHADIVARIKNTRTPFGIDFGIGDVIVPGAKKRKLPTQLAHFTAPNVNTYSIETTVAEKLDAILGLMEFSSRMKDYYDIYYLANKFDFNGKTLTEALKKRLQTAIVPLPSSSLTKCSLFPPTMPCKRNGDRSVKRSIRKAILMPSLK